MLGQFDWVEAVRTSVIMMALVGCSVLTLGAAIDRFLYFRRRAGNADLLLAKAIDRIRAGQFDAANELCRSSKHPLGPVALRVIESLREARGSSEEYLQIALSEQKLLLERNLSVLGSMAAIGPLVGLLGTVWGIMRAFHDMSVTGSAAPSVVAAGVSEALLTTAVGIVVAVPAVLLYNHFNRRMTVMLTVAENHARSLRAVYIEARPAHRRDESGEIQESILKEISGVRSKPEFITS